MTVWGLVDDRTGHTGQVLGVISKLGVPYVLKRLEYNRLAALPNLLLGTGLRHVTSAAQSTIAPPWPNLVIAAGRRTLPTLRFIKKNSPKTVTVYSGWPESTGGIDLIVAPEHDHPPVHDRVVTTLTPLHAITPETLVAAQHAWIERFKHLPKPWVALCIGGKTKKGDYKATDWHALLKLAQHLAGDGSLLITTSRRTPTDVVEMFASLLTCPHLLHRWDTDKDNPYLGILGCADAVIVTGDSLSMCAEACVSGKPVYIFSVSHVVPEKHHRLHNELFKRGMVRMLDSHSHIDWKPVAALDEAGRIADEIRKRFAYAVAG